MITTGVLMVYSGFLTRNTTLEVVGIFAFMLGGLMLLVGAGGYPVLGRKHFW